jgi:flagellar biosynthesis/type III secretory pathway protein FliH
MNPARLAFLRRSQVELQQRHQALNAAFARELHSLRESIAMAHELLEGEVDLGEEQVRALLKQVIEQHPRGRNAAELLSRIEDLERRLQGIAAELGE